MSVTTGSRTDERSALDVIADALGGDTVRADSRVNAATNPHSPDEGLALLSAYVAIEPQRVRQAILDVVVALAARSLCVRH